MLLVRYYRYVKATSFQYYPSTGNLKDEWKKCVQSIDVKNRGIKRLVNKEQ